TDGAQHLIEGCRELVDLLREHVGEEDQPKSRHFAGDTAAKELEPTRESLANDVLAVTHRDSPHATGARELEQQIRVRALQLLQPPSGVSSLDDRVLQVRHAPEQRVPILEHRLEDRMTPLDVEGLATTESVRVPSGMQHLAKIGASERDPEHGSLR